MSPGITVAALMVFSFAIAANSGVDFPGSVNSQETGILKLTIFPVFPGKSQDSRTLLPGHSGIWPKNPGIPGNFQSRVPRLTPLAANVQKIQRGAKAKRRYTIPTCAKKDTIFHAKEVGTISNVYNAGDCGAICSSMWSCQLWSYHEPRPGSQTTDLKSYDCVLKTLENSNHTSVLSTASVHKGIHSGWAGCKNFRKTNQIPICAEKDVYYEGEDFEVLDGYSSAYDCGHVCRFIGSCQIWSYHGPRPDSQPTDHKAYACVLQSTLNNTKRGHRGFHSGIKGCPTQEEFERDKILPNCAYKDRIFNAKDVGTIKNVSNADRCGKICSLTRTCQMWSYHQGPYPGGIPMNEEPPVFKPTDHLCILKSGTDLTTEIHEGVISGRRGCRKDEKSNQIPICAEKNIYYDALKILTVQRYTSASSCGKACLKLSECMYWSYYRASPESQGAQYGYIDGDCVMGHESSKPNRKEQKGFHSGRKGCE